MFKHSLLLFYVLLVAPISIVLFLYGFFPMAHHTDIIASQSDIPKHVGNFSIKKDVLYKPMVKKLIIMIIDGLRWDFVASPTRKVTMPLTNNLINSSGCLLRTKLQPPTVTMPRIKAMMTGTVPNFVDIILNLGSKPLHSDNFLIQAKKHGYKSIFYGDDTWLALFPYIFDRYDGTSSFFVTDFTEVDNNVTRHIQNELRYDDWTIMILHYLGLDHIGHVEGPFSTMIKPKLQEMDGIIFQIAQKVQEWNNDGIPALFIICGDHGMKDSGSHGGSTPEETTVPFVTIGGNHCLHQDNGESIEIEQLDIATTLSTVLGLPIPSTNIGSTFLDGIYELDDAKRLFLLYYNTKQVFNNFQKLAIHGPQPEYIYQKYLDTVNLHTAWLSTSETQSEMIKNIISSYNTILKIMKDVLINSIIEYDFYPMIIAVFFLSQILIILFFVQTTVWITHKRTALFFIMQFSLCLGIYFYSTSILNALLFFTVFSILYINCNLCINSDLSSIKFMKGPKIHTIFQIGALLHIASFAGSSFIEEEHQTWYFFWASAIAYFLYRNAAILFAHYLRNVSMRTEMNSNRNNIKHHIEISAKLLLLLIEHRILRKLNSTGNKWAHLPDIARWLKEDNSKVGMTILLLAALFLLLWIAHKCEDQNFKWQSSFFNMVIAACIYLRHMSSGAVMKIPLYPPSSGLLEVKIFWIIVTLFLLSYSYRIVLIIKRDRQRFASTIFFLINIWVMISAMLHQPHNVILLPLQIITSSILNSALKETDLFDLRIFVYYWLGNVFYFYQGNSNSLASINFAAGYVGLRSYMPFIIGVYLIINTYSAPVLAYFLLIYHRQLYQTHCINVIACTRSYITWRLLTITVYMIIVISQRHHLFVWSVFSPKLLYEAVYSTIMCCSALLALILIEI